MGKSLELALDQLPASLRKIALDMQPLYRATPAAIRKIVLEAGVHPEDLQAWADFNHPASDSYGRKLAYKGDHFEIMVMSWSPGDASAIHDHGFTQWGAVQVFGPGEHATFRIEEGVMHTASRGVLQPGQVIAVSHDLMHQMINPTTDQPFFSLHVYGLGHEIDNVTGEARVFDVLNGRVQRVDGGVFYALPPEGIKYIDEGPRGDFPTRLRHLVELARRMKKIEHPDLPQVADLIFSGEQHEELFSFLREILDENLHQTDSTAWCVINREMKEAARFQAEWLADLRGPDPFHQYAEWYDALVGKPCLDGFMANYLRFFQDQYGVVLSKSSILSLGCGTGLTEEFMIRELGVPYANLEGIDVSDAMLEVARRRIQARKEDIFDLGPGQGGKDIAFSGLNVFQYLDHKRLEEAIRRTASVIRPGGYFLGDFITPDHIRWYPNAAWSPDRMTMSLRSPLLIEEEGHIFQQSEIINIRFQDGKMRVSYAGKHWRFLPPMHRVRGYFEKAFEGKVELFDALSLAPIAENADSCPSTRYVVVAQRGL